MRNILKNITPIILALALVVTPAFSYADYSTSNGSSSTSNLNYDNPNSGGSSTSPYKFNVQGVLNSNLLMAVVGCTGIVNKITKATTGLIDKGVNKVSAKVKNINTVPTSDTTTQTDVEKANERLKTDAAREECFNGIAYMLAKNQLTAMTKATMNWVNTGLAGNPLYVQNQSSFLNSLTGAIIQREASWFPYNTTAYPYGRSYSRSLLNYQRVIGNFENRMQSSLLNYIAGNGSTNSYANNFSQGGWNGYLGLTQYPQNNPLGFSMTASQKIADDKVAAAKEAVDQINRNNGYLDQRVCKATKKQQDAYAGAPAELKAAQEEFEVAKRAYSEAFDAYVADQSNNQKYQVVKTMKDALDKAQARLTKAQSQSNTSVATVSGNPNIDCTEWQTVTPGSTIRDKVSTYVNSPERQLELADTLNESLNILFTALIAKFQNNGLPSLATSTNRYSAVSTSSTTNTSDTSSTSNGFVGYVDITKDLGKIIQTQKDFVKAANVAIAVAPKVVPAVAELDYCIPGPNPNWQENSLPFKDAYFDYLNSIGTDYVQAHTPKWETVTANLFDPLHLFGSHDKDTSFYRIKLGDESIYENMFPGDTGIANQLAHDLGDIGSYDPLWHRACNNPSDCYSNEGRVTLNPESIETDVINPWTDRENNNWNSYVSAYNNAYGVSSPMQTEIIDAGGGNLIQNPKYLPMASAGLAITKNLKSLGDDMPGVIDGYKTSIADANSNVYKLNQIKAEVDVIVAAAQKRRKDARAAAGLPPISNECLAIEMGQ